jgi:hypothetical protein
MLAAGDTAIIPIILQDAAGAALSYADKAAFLSDGWDVDWYDKDGGSISVTWDLLTDPTANQPDVYILQYTVPLGEYSFVVDVPSTHVVVPAAMSGNAESFSIDDLYGSIVTQGGTVVSSTTSNSSITVYQDDSIYAVAVIPEAALTAVGASSLADLDAYKAEMKLTSTAGNAPPDLATFTEAILSDTVGNRTIAVSLAAFPSILDVDGSSGDTVSARIDTRITKGTKTITASTIDVISVWSASEA